MMLAVVTTLLLSSAVSLVSGGCLHTTVLSTGDVSYDSFSSYCTNRGQALCSGDEICTQGSLDCFLNENLDNNQWVPIRDSVNAWIQIANPVSLCKTYLEVNAIDPSWGDDPNPESFEGHVACCDIPTNTTTDTSTGNLVLTRDDGIASTDEPANPISSSIARFLFEVENAFETPDFFCSLDGAIPTSCTSPVMLTGLADGPHTFSVSVNDRSPVSDDWVIDTNPATLGFTSVPSTLMIPGVDVTIEYNASEPVTFQCDYDGDAQNFADCGDGMTGSITFTSITERRHVFTLRAWDAASNLASSIVFEFTGDSCFGTTCAAPTCTSTSCSCNGGYYMDLDNNHICHACRDITCPPGTLACTNSVDSICGDCDTIFDKDLQENKVDCRVVTSWGP